MFRNKFNKGQSSIEAMLVLGFVLVPALVGGMYWISAEWKQSQCAFQKFKQARLQMIRTQQAASSDEVTLLPLEELDQNKGGLSVNDALKEVSQLWEQLSSP